MAAKRLCWTAEESQTVCNRAAQLIFDRKVDLKWDAGRVFGLSEILEDAQLALPQHRRRPNIALQVSGYKGEVRLALERLQQARKAEVAALIEPPRPSVAALDPRVAEALVVLFERGVQAIGKMIGEAMVEANRTRHMYVPQPLPESKPEEGKNGAETHGDLPEHLRKHKVLVASIKPIQQQQLMRSFPNIEFRFIPPDAPSKVAREVGQKCERNFLMIRFVSHSVTNGLKDLPHTTRIPGSVSEVERLLQFHFPKTPYRGHVELGAHA